MVQSTIIRLLPTQIPEAWEAIKLAAVRAAEVPEPAVPAFLVKLLHGLLSEKVQCFVRMSEERVILTIFLTQVRENIFTGEHELECWALYSFKLIDDASARAGMEAMVKVAKSQHCATLTTMSRHPRLWQMYERLEWKELHRSYVYHVGEG